MTFRYTGATMGADTVFSGANLVSSFGFVGSGTFTSQTHRCAEGTLLGPIGTVEVPAVPEPGAMIFITSISFNLLSDGLRSAMDNKG